LVVAADKVCIKSKSIWFTIQRNCHCSCS